MRNLRTFRIQKGNSLTEWYKIKNPFIVCINFLIVYLCRILPSLSLKRFLLRAIGVKIGKNVSIGLMAMFDIFWPELITIGDNAVIGYNITIICHEFLIKEYRVGEVKIGKNVMVGTNATILPGINIGDNATISACSLVNKDVPANSFVGGVPAKQIIKVSK